MDDATEIFVNGVRFVRACDQTQGCGGTVTISPPPKKTRGQEVAEKMMGGKAVEMVEKAMAELASAIDAERKAERERCAKAADMSQKELTHGTNNNLGEATQTERGAILAYGLIADAIRALPD